jgi:lysophospholipase L1-like esterase
MDAARAPHPPLRRRVLLWSATLAIAAVLALLTAEVGLRAHEAWQRGRPAPLPAHLDLLRENPHGTGSYRLKPNVRLETRVGGRRVLVRTNSHGMPWREVEVAKAPGRQRVAFLGDSFAFGCWADTVERSLVGVFEDGVSRARWEALNFGVGGYGLLDMELLLREEVLRFSPDYVVIVLFTGNDFRDTFLGLDKERIVNGTAELDEENVRRRVPPELRAEDTRGPRARAEEPRGAARMAVVRRLAPLLGLENLALDFAVRRNFTMFSFWQGVPYPPAARAATDQVLAAILRMRDLAAAQGADLGVVALPTAEQVHSARTSGLDYDIGFPQAYVQVFAREQGIPYLDLLPPFRDDVRERNRRLYVEGDIHLNNRGHALAGRLVADWFRCCVKAGAGPRPPRPATSPTP